eukprot:gene17492-2925_t
MLLLLEWAPLVLECLLEAHGRDDALVQPLIEALEKLLAPPPPLLPPPPSLVKALNAAALQIIQFLRPLLLSAAVHSAAAAPLAIKWRSQHAAASWVVGATELALGRRPTTSLYNCDLAMLLLPPLPSLGPPSQRVPHTLLPALHAAVAEAEQAQFRPKRAARSQQQQDWHAAAAKGAAALALTRSELKELAAAEMARCAARYVHAAAPAALRPVKVLDQPSTQSFAAEAKKGMPVVITGAIDHWRALEKWKDPMYLSAKAGHRTVPVEVGAAHRKVAANEEEEEEEEEEEAEEGGTLHAAAAAAAAAAEPQQLLMTLNDYMKDYVYNDCAITKDVDDHQQQRQQDLTASQPPLRKRRRCNTHTDEEEEASTAAEYTAVSAVVPVTSARTAGYLAQRTFFDQVPALAHDFVTPSGSAVTAPAINMWFGGSGVGTPLHFDRHSNVLAQVVGCKRVLLVNPKYSSNLYPQTEVDNASSVDVEAPNLERHPRFADSVLECVVLLPGEMLYIPHGYWHAVASISTSISLSFWY